jgi:hypothetical protein
MPAGEHAKQPRVVAAGNLRQGEATNCDRNGGRGLVLSQELVCNRSPAPRAAAHEPHMARLRVKLDLPAISDHLSREEGRRFSEQEVRTWLQEAKFTLDAANTAAGERWIVNEADLGQLEPSEVLHVERLDE